ncbi:hypothetical protein [Vibrio campbellii]|uniref:hypothetical protein n=1 Tax=Vibrio campbellii TaxID=680 RepID=UPI0018C87A15|nr:hypothetical protein [Vibrio campbellii]
MKSALKLYWENKFITISKAHSLESLIQRKVRYNNVGKKSISYRVTNGRLAEYFYYPVLNENENENDDEA